jgi:uncharacterized protein (TIGR02246 family)
MRRGQERLEAKLKRITNAKPKPALSHDCRRKIVRKPGTPGLLVVMASAIMLLSAPARAQNSPAEQEILQIRQKMARSFAEAVNNKDGMHAADQYSTDVVFSLLTPTQMVVVGREAMQKRWEAILKAGTISEYSGTPKEVHLIGDGTAWSTGTFTYTATDKDGSKRRVQGNWLDMLRREADGQWRITFQASASGPVP